MLDAPKVIPLKPATTTEIPIEFGIDCAKHGNQPTRAANYCPTCEHFRGILRLIDDEEKANERLAEKGLTIEDIVWSERFAISCAYPRPKKVYIADLIE